MRKFYFISTLLFLSLLFALPQSAIAKGNGKNKNPKNTSVRKVTADPANTILDINNITSWIDNAGFMQPLVGSSWNGTYPKGTDGVIYQEGTVWGGLVHDGGSEVVRVGGNSYSNGTTGLTRIFRVRPDYATADLSDDAANFNMEPLNQVNQSQMDVIRAQYDKDWQEWPANLGAPYQDLNNDGKYDPSVDIPGVPGASQTLWLTYDDRNAPDIYGAQPIGMKVIETLWGYATTNPLGNVTFRKVDLIYTGTSSSLANSTIDSMYITAWADPDVGNSTDDFAGCDTALNMGYAYNSTAVDADYAALGLAPPSVGYDFLQGVSQYSGNYADSAMFNLKWRHGYKYVNNKPMSGFEYFASGGTWSDPDLGSYNGSLQWYNLQRGSLPRPTYPTFSPFPAEAVDYTPDGTFLLDGDPVTGTGKNDGSVDASGDRRIMVNNGPFNMKLGDTAEVVVALVAGLGSNNLSSVSVMKYNDVFAQYAYDNLFNLPLFPPPEVNVANLDKEIVLSWGGQKSVDAIENVDHAGFAFEGYNVYQFPTASGDLSQAVKIATYDVINDVTVILDNQLDLNTGVIIQKPVQVGKNTGISRFISITQDIVRSQPLRDGQDYYFAVTAYGYNPSPDVPFHALESSPVVLKCVPQATLPGTKYATASGDTLKFTHSTGKSDGYITPIVVDPSVTTGDSYKVSFASDGTWTLTDVTTGKATLTAQANQSGDDNYPIANGLLLKVVGPPVAVNTYKFVPAADRWFTGVNAGLESFFGGLGIGANFFGSSVTPDQYVTVEIRFKTNVADGQKAYRYLRGGTPSYGYQDYTNQHFTVWDVTSNPPRQLAAAYVTQTGSAVETGPWEPTANSGDREYLFIFNSPYTPDPDPFFTDASRNILNNADQFPTLYAMWPLQRGTMPYNPQDGQVFTIIPNFANTTNDVFTYTVPKNTVNDPALAKADANKVNVFPNPYYGYQDRETSRASKYITFSHLPTRATIRIFDLSGVLVKTINKTDVGQFINWNLQNENNYPVASGIYVAYIDMPDLGTTKILKLAILQEEQILNVY